MGTFASYARRLFENGYSIIPVRGKAPVIERWQEYCHRAPTENEVTNWETQFADCNIGMPGGPANKIIWLDCDAYTEVYALRMLELLPHVQIKRVGQKGFVTPVRFTGQKKKYFNYRGVPMGEFLGEGRQIAALGLHPVTGEAYRWIGANQITDLTLEELHEISIVLTDTELERIEKQLESEEFELHPLDLEKKKVTTNGGVGGRNNRLKAICGGMFERGETVEKVAAEILRVDKNHKKPLFEDRSEVNASPVAAALNFAGSIFKTFVAEKDRKGEVIPQLGSSTENAPEPIVIDFERNKQGAILSNADNCVRALEGLGVLQHFWYDEFYDRIRRKTDGGQIREWRDVDDKALMVYLQREVGIQAQLSTVQNAVELVADHRRRNEPRDWFESLSWDGVERIGSFFVNAFGVTDAEYVKYASRNFWIAMAARIYSPGCKFDNMVVLEGGQGKFKSTALGMIGGDWFLESGADISSKDFLQSLNGKMLVEIAELDGFRGADVKTIKRVLSTRIDTYRPSYGRRATDFHRQCVFVGTTNEDEYLEDATGGRRFWPVKIGKVTLSYIEEHRAQLFAEAVFKYKRGDTYWEMPDSTASVQRDRQRGDSWTDVLADWLRKQDGPVKPLDLAMVALKITDHTKITPGVERRIGAVMRTLHWSTHVKKGKNRRSYRVWTRDPEAEPFDPIYAASQETASEISPRHKLGYT